jgi:hypothetical protein
MTYLGPSAAKQISRELTAGEISDGVSNAIQNIAKLPERSPQTAKRSSLSISITFTWFRCRGTIGGAVGVWTHLSDKPSEFARNVRTLVNVIGVDHVHRSGY